MKGTKKQIAWAEDIKTKLLIRGRESLRHIFKRLPGMKSGKFCELYKTAEESQLQAANNIIGGIISSLEFIEACDDAVWLIENRHENFDPKANLHTDEDYTGEIYKALEGLKIKASIEIEKGDRKNPQIVEIEGYEGRAGAAYRAIAFEVFGKWAIR